MYRSFQQWRLHVGKENAARRFERYGQASGNRPQGKLIWFHAASNGESLSIINLIKALHKDDSRLNFLITTGTVTSAALLTKLLPAYAQHQFIPYDVPQWLKKFLQYWQPDVFITIESELWPNMIAQTSSLSIPMILINACMSQKSITFWKFGKTLLQFLLNSFRLILTQSIEHTQHLQNLGIQHVHTVGNLKFASSPLPYKADNLATIKQESHGRLLWLAASTHEGEETIIIQAHKKLIKHFPNLLTIIVPRHITRSEKITSLMDAESISYAVRSHKQPIHHDTQVYLADTIGEMGLFYKLSPIAFVGGSLDSTGGHNLIEPALMDCAILHGLNMHKQKAMAQLFRESQAAIIVHNVDDLVHNIQSLLTDTELCSFLQQRAYDVALRQRKVLQQTLNLVQPIIHAVS